MAEDRATAEHKRRVTATPDEFRPLALWGWHELRPTLFRLCCGVGMTQSAAWRSASRIQAIVVREVQTDAELERIRGCTPSRR